jgi:hypothetical protein
LHNDPLTSSARRNGSGVRTSSLKLPAPCRPHRAIRRGW